MKTKAAIVYKAGQPLIIENVDLETIVLLGNLKLPNSSFPIKTSDGTTFVILTEKECRDFRKIMVDLNKELYQEVKKLNI